MQNGLGLLLKMLISSAMQVIVFSPPESWRDGDRLLARRVGDDFDAGVERVDVLLHDRQHGLPSGPSVGCCRLAFSSSSVSRKMSAFPPPNSLRNMPWKCSRTALKVCSKRRLIRR